MLLLLALNTPAQAGDVALYARAMAYVDGFYLHPEAVNRERMFEDAGRQAERSIEWLLVDINGPVLTLHDGQGAWHSEVRLERPSSLATSLGALEDALRAAPHAIPPEIDLRVEILRGMVRSLDRHSVILADSNLARFDERLSGTMTGVGVSCGVRDGALVVTDVLPGSPAERGGVVDGDRVLHIDSRSTVGMVAGDVGTLLRGPAGSLVTVRVARAGEAPASEEILDLTLERAEVHLPNVFVDRAEGDVGVVRIDHFSEQTHEWLYKSLDTIRESPVSSLVLDLRGNTGGSLMQSADAADAFLQHGRIVSTVGPDGHSVTGLTETFDAGPDNPPEALPTAVLVDHLTASGSEILSGALQHLGRALVFGTNSFGKGTVQKVYPLTADVKFKLTVAEYRLANDARVVDVGIHPDVLFYPYRFDADGVWFPDPEVELRYAPAGTIILPLAEEYAGWRGGPVHTKDGALDAAVGLISAAEGASREKLLSGLDLIAPSLEASFDDRLQEVFGARGMDWSPVPPGVVPGPVLGAGVLTVDSPHPDEGDVTNVEAGSAVTLRVSVRNDGTPLWRARVRLRSLNGVWDDRVLPLGRFPGGTSRTGETRLTVPLASAARADTVELWLEADGVPPRRIGERVLGILADPPLELGATLRARTDHEGRMTVDVALSELGEGSRMRDSRPLRLRFAWPNLPGVELEVPAQVAVDLPSRGTVHAGLALRLGPAAPQSLPLTLVVETASGAEVERWPITIDQQGSVRVQPPTLSLRPLSNVQPPGMALLQIRAGDDERVDHVIVYAGTERVDRTRYEPETIWDARKVSWSAPGLGDSEPGRIARRLDETVAVAVYPGENRYLITVTDGSGLQTEQVVYLLGQMPEATAEAGNEGSVTDGER